MAKDGTYFIGVDVGGTKIYAAMILPSGQIVERHRVSTPFGASCEEILQAIIRAVSDLIETSGVNRKTIGGVGLAIPGLIEYEKQQITESPNMTISGRNLVVPVQDALGLPVTLGNDTDVCTLGEQWVGAARNARCAVGMFVGTGIGGGILVDRKMLGSTKYSAAEIGHMILQIDGPLCGCGSRGCLEALASRTAIERDLRAALAAGKATVLREWLSEEDRRIRSGMLARALEVGDELVTDVLQKAGRAMGLACMTLRHIFEPDVIILGGGVMEACGDFLLPRVEKEITGDPYFGSRPGGRIVLSALSDDAGILGAAALAMQSAGLDPFDPKTSHELPYPAINLEDNGTIRIGKKVYGGDVILRVGGKGRKRGKNGESPRLTLPAELTAKDLSRACKGGPELLIIGTAAEPGGSLDPVASRYLSARAIDHEILPLSKAIKRFEAIAGRKALLLLTGK